MHTVQLMPLPLTLSCFSKIQIGFTFLLLAHLGSPRQRAIKWVCVGVCVCVFCYHKDSLFLMSEKCLLSDYSTLRCSRYCVVLCCSAVTESLMSPAQFPGCNGTRNLHDNLSDLRAQVAANQKVCLRHFLLSCTYFSWFQFIVFH